MEALWSRPLHARPGTHAVAAEGGVLVVAERHSRLARLDPRSGEMLWEHRIESRWGSAAVGGGHCLYVSQTGVLDCLDAHDGRPRWQLRMPAHQHHLTVGGDLAFVGGWRGYRPMTRIRLSDGTPVPGVVTSADVSRPVPVGSGALLFAARDEPALYLVRSVDRADRWVVPAPVDFPDAGDAFGDGVVFVCGRRTVMAFGPERGVQALWRHDRDLPWCPPVLGGGTLWLAEDASVTVVDLVTGGRTVVTDLPRGAVCAGVATPAGALLPRGDGHLVVVDRSGRICARVRVPAPIDRLLPGDGDLVHVAGKGHLTTLGA
ncbi:PQQ-binding-like beta-propeller repeat protein [Dactylosporangium sp. NPDC005555]|uniref:outer membrane protein assembly factor BamB family protein n=1 Tax=Dactylosporangium sp. NPDC005555 TaxID=3154889 RepID=UPI0033A45DC7